MILGYGGTIAMVPDKDGTLKPAKCIEEILAIVPTIQEMAEISFLELENRDSTNINPGHWSKLAMKIADVYKDYDGILVTHGTDTMAYTAGAVSLALGAGLPIPVVFTGSQLPLVAYGTDARFNLENSIKTIIEACNHKIGEVMIVFSDRVLRANRAIKTSESKFPAFDSPAFPWLATISATGVSFIPTAFFQTSKNNPPLSIKPHFQRGILSVEIVPGLEPSILMEVLQSGKCQGLLLKSLGAGNVPIEDEYSLLPVIQSATQTYHIPVLISTKFIGGMTHMDIYEPGKLALEAGAVPTGDMTDAMAQVKFMWALAQGYRSLEDLRRVMQMSYVGEVTTQ